tara:strand:+ start:31 stop:300 length:270 start_codon:yes stop_codon:yes gene_type:complete
MDTQTVFQWVVGVGSAVVGWMLKMIVDAIRDVRSEMKNLDRKIHDDFVRRDDFKESVRDLKDDMRLGFNKVDATLGLLFKKLDNKDDCE